MTQPISVDQALSAYGYVYNLAQNIPELNNYLQQAIQGGWTADKLTAMVESSNWWKSNSNTVRQLVTNQFTDPATYQQDLQSAQQRIQLKAQALGRTIPQAQLQSLALQTLTSNSSWDDNVLSQLVTNNSAIGNEGVAGTYAGDAGQLTNHMQQVAESFGVPYSPDFLNGWVNKIQSGADTLDGFESLMQARASATYPQFANQIAAGQTLKDIADPYVSTMAQTLEIPTTSVKLTDPSIQKALNAVDPKTGQQSAAPLWQFQQQLKADPRYDQTTQAKSDAFSTLSQIGKDFGFTQGGSVG